MDAVDITRLPDDVAVLVDALGPGEELVITRGVEVLATITGADRAHEHDPDDDTADDHEHPPTYDDVTVVATAMKLSATARRALAAELGPNYVVLDMRAAPASADVVLLPPCSPQLVGNIRSVFPEARVIVTEIDDPEIGISYQGPIRRTLDAGAETYLAATAVPVLAKQLDLAITHRMQLTAGPDPRVAIEPSTPQD